MTNPFPYDPDDPHGYGRLNLKLSEFRLRLTALGEERYANLVRQAELYYGGSPTEFLGEARSALQAVLRGADDLPPEFVSAIREVVEAINEGFRRVGGG